MADIMWVCSTHNAFILIHTYKYYIFVVFHLLIKMLTPIDMKNTDHCAVKNDVTLIPEHYLSLTLKLVMLSSLAWFLLLSVLPASRRCFNLDSGSMKTLQGESGDCFRYNISDIHGTMQEVEALAPCSAGRWHISMITSTLGLP